MNIFVAKLNFKTTEDDLRDLFEEFGDVDTVKIIMDKETDRSKGFGFVEMADEESGQKAIDELNETEFQGRYIVVKKARPREDNNRGGGYGGGRGGYGGGRGGNRGGYGGGNRGGFGGGGYDRRDNY